MTNLPKNPKPNIEKSRTFKTSRITTFNYDKALEEMVDLVRKNKELTEDKNPQENEALHG